MYFGKYLLRKCAPKLTDTDTGKITMVREKNLKYLTESEINKVVQENKLYFSDRKSSTFRIGK